MKRHVSRPPRATSCTGKKAYAKEAAEDMARYRASQDGSLMDAYRCQFTHTLADGSPAWHIGHRIVSKSPLKRTR